MSTLAKMMFPKVQPHEFRRNARAFMLAIVVGVLCASVVSGMILWAYYSDRFRL
jgi:hypothetical protein